jgi:hypothetical protein
MQPENRYFVYLEELHRAVNDFVERHPDLKPLDLEGQFLRRYRDIALRESEVAAASFAKDIVLSLHKTLH